jgi:hypothetical protein
MAGHCPLGIGSELVTQLSNRALADFNQQGRGAADAACPAGRCRDRSGWLDLQPFSTTVFPSVT